MKKKIIILTAFMGLLLSACSDFLDRKPLTQPEDKGFLVGREQLENYINGLYSALPTPTPVSYTHLNLFQHQALLHHRSESRHDG